MSPEERIGVERDAFETAAHDLYLRVKAMRTEPMVGDGDGTRQSLFWRNADGTYGVEQWNAAWWGWLAGQELCK